MPDDNGPPATLVTPDEDDDEGTPQGPRKRLPWSKPAVPTRPTLSERRQFKKAARKVADE